MCNQTHQNQIFISYSCIDYAFVEELYNQLKKKGCDPWIDLDPNDIPEDINLRKIQDWDTIPEDIKAEIKRYIEGAEIFIFVVSHHSKESTRNKQEAIIAAKERKKIILVKAADLSEEDLPSDLINEKRIDSNLNFKDLENSINQAAVTFDCETIAKAIIDIHTHKRLNDKALQWSQSKERSNLLLRPTDLKGVQAWQQKNKHIQLEAVEDQYIRASEETQLEPDVFVSYRHEDQEFVKQLYSDLENPEGKLVVWIDDNIPVASLWQQEICDGIQAAHSFLIVNSPSYSKSPYCLAELIYAIKQSKRIISIIPPLRDSDHYQEPNYVKNILGEIDYAIDKIIEKLESFEQNESNPNHGLKYFNAILKITSEIVQTKLQTNCRGSNYADPDRTRKIGDLQSLYFRKTEGSLYQDNLNKLKIAIQKDADTHKEYTYFLRKTEKWLDKPEPHLLLSDKEIQDAEKLLLKLKEPNVSPSLKEYLENSKNFCEKKKWRLKKMVGGVCLAFIVTSFVAYAIVSDSKHKEIDALVVSLEGNQELDALVIALEAGEQLNWWNPSFQLTTRMAQLLREPESDLQVRTVTALQQQIYKLRELNRFPGHTAQVFNVSFSPDGSFLASASFDGTAQLWQPNGKLVKPTLKHNDGVVGVIFNPGIESNNSQLLATASYDKTIKLWRIEGNDANLPMVKDLKTLQGHQDKIFTITSDPGGLLLASGSRDGTAKLWDWQGKNREITLHHAKPSEIVASISFNRFGDRLITGATDGTVKLWTRQGTLIQTFEQGNPVLNVSFSPDGEIFAAADTQGIVKLWKANGDLVKTLVKHESSVNQIAFSPNGQILASASDDGTVNLWKRNGDFLRTLRGHQKQVYRVRFSPNSQIIATAGTDDTVKLWLTEDGTLLDSLEGHQNEVLGINFSSDGKTIASASADTTVRLWKVKSPLQLLPHDNFVFDANFQPNFNMLASSTQGTIKLWRQDGTLISDNPKDFKGSKVSRVSFSSDGKLLASSSEDFEGKSEVKLWRIANGKLLRVITLKAQGKGSITSLKFNRNGSLLAVARRQPSNSQGNSVVEIWQLQRQAKEAFPGEGLKYKLYPTLSEKEDVLSVSFSPKTDLLVSANSDGTIRFWKQHGTSYTAFGELIKVHQGAINSVAFSPNGEIIASAGANGVIQLWKIQTRELIKQLTDLDGNKMSPIASLSFSPNGKLLASAHQNGMIKLWTASGTLITTLKWHNRSVTSVSFSPDSKTLMSSSEDYKVLLGRLPEDFNNKAFNQLLREGCSLASNYLEHASSKDAKEVRSFCQQQDLSKTSEFEQPTEPDSSSN